MHLVLCLTTPAFRQKQCKRNTLSQMATAQLTVVSQYPLESKLAMDLNKPACPGFAGSDHVQDTTTSKNLLDLFLSPQFSQMEQAAKKEISQPLSLSPSTCISVRSVAKQNELSDLVTRCDLYIDAMLPDMLAREDVLSLPRIQVNVRASSNAVEFTSDYSLIEDVIPKAVQNLEHADCSSHLEEKVLEMYLEGDYVTTCLKSSKMLSPEKPEGTLRSLQKLNPSPARKLILDDCFEDVEEVENKPRPGTWRIISMHKLSHLSGVCLVEHNSSLVLVNVSLVAQALDNPVSPTTGLPYPEGTSFMAPMSVAKSGFGLVPLEGSLLSVGGFNRDGCLVNTERYNFTQNCWDNVGNLSMPRARFGLAKLGETVFAIGGSDGRRELSSVETFNPMSQKWQLHESKLNTPRSCFGATTLNGQIYVLGGLYYSTPLKSAEVFNPSTKRWESLPSMTTWRRDVAVTSCMGKVYAIGGQTSGWSCLASVESYDPATRKWTKAPSMKTPRRNATAVTLNNKIYVIGGYNGASAIRHVEVYDPQTLTWTQCCSLNVKRSYAAAVVVDECVYVVGGYAGSSFLNSIERFDTEANQWTPFV